MEVSRQPGKPRTIYKLGGWGPQNGYEVHNNDVKTLYRAVAERVFYVKGEEGFVEPPLPKENHYKTTCMPFLKAIAHLLPVISPIEKDQFPLYYKGRRQTIYQQAVDSLKSKLVNKKDSVIRPFVKAEKIDFLKKSDPSPRLIQPRDPRYNVEVGIFIKPIEHPIYRAIAELYGDTTVMKSLNASQVGQIFKNKWDLFTDPIAFGLDASRFDQHVSVDALKMEHLVYLSCFRGADRDRLSKLLKWQLNVDGIARCYDGSVRYKHAGGRMSGDMNTALGNCVIMCMLLYVYALERQVNIRLANNGDDCVVFCERGDYGKLIDGLFNWFLDMGFNMKIEEPCFVLEQIEFCQAHPVNVNGEYRMVRNCPISLAKDCVSLIALNNKKIFEKWKTAVGECGLALTSGVPVYQECYNSMIVKNVKPLQKDQFKDNGMFITCGDMSGGYEDVADETRVSFYLAFGITPAHQIALEDHYKSSDFSYNNPVPVIINLGNTKLD